MTRSRRNTKKKGGVSANEQGKGFAQIPRVLLESLAYQKLKCLAAAKALPVFICKFNNAAATTGKAESAFCYGEAKKLHGIPSKSFARGIKELHNVGFIDVLEKGGVWEGNQWSETVYRRSERWRKYGTFDFITLPWIPSEPAKQPNISKKRKGQSDTALRVNMTP